MTRLAILLAAALAATPVFAEVRAPLSKTEISLSFAPVVKAAAPAVVNIYATRVVESRVSPFAGDPFFGQLFRDFGETRPEVQNSLGSGVIVAAGGLVVSNYHVVEAATDITVVLTDKREFKAEVVLADQVNDLAVLRLKDAADLPVLPFRDSDGVEVGDLVLAIGNPFGIGQTVSMGIISALARSSISVGDGHGYFLQTDAAINPGNSGGALVDAEGRLVGINTAILTQSGGSNGVGFAIPSNLVRAVVAQAEAGASRFQRPWAGVSGQAVDGALAEGLGLAVPEGVILSELHPASPFAAGGLVAGDVVLRLAGAPVNSPAEMIFRMSSHGVGAAVAVDYLHKGKPRSATVQLIAPPEQPARDTRKIGSGSVLEGLEVARINPAVIAELDLPLQAEGVAVLASAAWAAQAGLQAGDILLSINGARIATPADVAAAAANAGRSWSIDLVRRGQPMRLRFRV
ncbi:trypsin-like peptidase domain-containing protein [Gemmobacter nectariphilus]|uniref:trypsin-like peptidase domain-containing protein n=1 Tax=Gemmobacter nectariphilus TaxID=220343 RepID=UPI000428ABC7|nr:trypsin-like peptidase domain-containing protein [Gemmobacter nectariphilus]